MTFVEEEVEFFPSETSIFNFLDTFNSPEEESERKLTPKGTSKILPVGGNINFLHKTNQSLLEIAQKLSPQKEATIDMDNQFIQSNKANANYSYHKEKGYSPFNAYWSEQDLMLWSEFSDGNVPPGKEQLRVFLEAEKQLPSNIRIET